MNAEKRKNLEERYPAGAFNPHIHQYGIMVGYNEGSNRKNDHVSLSGKIIGLGKSKRVKDN